MVERAIAWNFLGFEKLQPFVAGTDVTDGDTVRRERALDQPADTGIVVDVEDLDLLHLTRWPAPA